MQDNRSGAVWLQQVFSRSVVLLLALTALAKLYSAAGEARILAVWDPSVPLTNRELSLGVGLNGTGGGGASG